MKLQGLDSTMLCKLLRIKEIVFGEGEVVTGVGNEGGIGYWVGIFGARRRMVFIYQQCIISMSINQRFRGERMGMRRGEGAELPTPHR
jgi:hypothetical protein